MGAEPWLSITFISTEEHHRLRGATPRPPLAILSTPPAVEQVRSESIHPLPRAPRQLQTQEAARPVRRISAQPEHDHAKSFSTPKASSPSPRGRSSEEGRAVSAPAEAAPVHTFAPPVRPPYRTASDGLVPPRPRPSMRPLLRPTMAGPPTAEAQKDHRANGFRWSGYFGPKFQRPLQPRPQSFRLSPPQRAQQPAAISTVKPRRAESLSTSLENAAQLFRRSSEGTAGKQQPAPPTSPAPTTPPKQPGPKAAVSNMAVVSALSVSTRFCTVAALLILCSGQHA